MSTLSVTDLVLFAALSATPQPPAEISTPPVQVAAICMRSGEATSGLNKICYYTCGGSQAAITIRAGLCPATIQR